MREKEISSWQFSIGVGVVEMIINYTLKSSCEISDKSLVDERLSRRYSTKATTMIKRPQLVVVKGLERNASKLAFVYIAQLPKRANAGLRSRGGIGWWSFPTCCKSNQKNKMHSWTRNWKNELCGFCYHIDWSYHCDILCFRSMRYNRSFFSSRSDVWSRKVW